MRKEIILTAVVSSLVTVAIVGVLGGLFVESSSVAPAAILRSSETESSVVEAVKRASPAVFSIVVSKDVPVVERYFDNSNPFGDFFTPFNFQIPQLRQKGTEKREVGGGTGFFITSDGLAITNRHVVADEQADYTALTNDGEKHTVKVIARDPVLDIAVIRVEGGGFSPLEFETQPVRVGQTAIAIGNSLGEFRNTVSVGVVSGLARSITASDGTGEAEHLDEVIQTDAAINPGNSGGPLLNSNGKVIGVNVAMARGSENIGFALPASAVKAAAESVEKTGKIIRPFLGVKYGPNSEGDGVVVLEIVKDSPAYKSELAVDDIILEIDGTKITAEKSLASIIRQETVGQTINLKILHRGTQKTLKVTLEAAK